MTNNRCAICEMLFADEDISGSCKNWRECGAEFLCSACCSYDGEEFLCNCCNDKQAEEDKGMDIPEWCPCCQKDVPHWESGAICPDCVEKNSFCVMCLSSVELPVEKSKEYTCSDCGEHFCSDCAKCYQERFICHDCK
jgi:hypothetical protein